MRSNIRSSIRSRVGAGKTEYIVLVALIGIGAIGVIMYYGNNMRGLYSASDNSLAGMEDTTPATRQADTLLTKNLKNFGHNANAISSTPGSVEEAGLTAQQKEALRIARNDPDNPTTGDWENRPKYDPSRIAGGGGGRFIKTGGGQDDLFFAREQAIFRAITGHDMTPKQVAKMKAIHRAINSDPRGKAHVDWGGYQFQKTGGGQTPGQLDEQYFAQRQAIFKAITGHDMTPEQVARMKAIHRAINSDPRGKAHGDWGGYRFQKMGGPSAFSDYLTRRYDGYTYSDGKGKRLTYEQAFDENDRRTNEDLHQQLLRLGIQAPPGTVMLSTSMFIHPDNKGLKESLKFGVEIGLLSIYGVDHFRKNYPVTEKWPGQPTGI